MAQTIEDVESRTLLQQFHSLYKKQDAIETNVENVDAKVDQETVDRQSADLSINSEIQVLKDQIDSLGVLFTYKGEVATIQDLPATGNKPGDVYYVDSDQSGYIWLEKSGVYQWEQFGPAIDLSQYAKQEDLEQTQSELTATDTQVKNNTAQIANLINSKQDKLTAGDNIKIENNVISSTTSDTKKLYRHTIEIGDDNHRLSPNILEIITSSNVAFNVNTFFNYVKNNNLIIQAVPALSVSTSEIRIVGIDVEYNKWSNTLGHRDIVISYTHDSNNNYLINNININLGWGGPLSSAYFNDTVTEI